MCTSTRIAFRIIAAGVPGMAGGRKRDIPKLAQQSEELIGHVFTRVVLEC
ncbi:hypothetical protein [Aliiruegeria haliotis]|nr:hypothetical protein [Aliiruegeria haliotis]